MSNVGEIIIQSVATLSSVAVGGFLSYMTQSSLQKRKSSEQERKNEELERREKCKAYNRILYYNTSSSPLIIDMHYSERDEFDVHIYNKSLLKQDLYNNLHLFRTSLVEAVLRLDDLIEDSTVKGYEPETEAFMASTYKRIITLIREDYNSIWINAKESERARKK